MHKTHQGVPDRKLFGCCALKTRAWVHRSWPCSLWDIESCMAQSKLQQEPRVRSCWSDRQPGPSSRNDSLRKPFRQTHFCSVDSGTISKIFPFNGCEHIFLEICQPSTSMSCIKAFIAQQSRSWSWSVFERYGSITSVCGGAPKRRTSEAMFE